jgi:hypothetical protein
VPLLNQLLHNQVTPTLLKPDEAEHYATLAWSR